VEALAVWQAAGTPPDEARQLVAGIPIDVETLLAAPAAPTSVDLAPLWRAHTRELQELLADMIARGGDARHEALAALDARPDGLALGALTGDGDAALAPETTAAVHEVVQPIADRLAGLLDDSDPETRALALRLLAKLGDDRVTPARIASAAFDAAPGLAGAAAFAAGRSAGLRPATAPAIAAALGPVLGDESWRRRMAAVDVLAALGPAGVALLERTRSDKHAVVRAAATEALAKRQF
jgi:HEAT repeat protein